MRFTRHILILACLWLSHHSSAQYEYFNEVFDIDAQPEFTTNIEVGDSCYFVYTVRSEDSGQVQAVRHLNLQGEELWIAQNDLGGNNFFFSLYSDSFARLSDNSTIVLALSQQGDDAISHLFRFDEDFSELLWEIQFTSEGEYPCETIDLSQFRSGSYIVMLMEKGNPLLGGVILKE